RFVNLSCNEDYQNHRYDCDRQVDDPVLDDGCQHIVHCGNSRYHDCVGQLCGNVVDMVTLRTCGCHDGGIGNRRAVVTSNSTSQCSRYSDNHQFAAGVQNRNNDGQQDTECTPGCTCGERQEYGDQEYDNRQHHVQHACAVLQDTCNEH